MTETTSTEFSWWSNISCMKLRQARLLCMWKSWQSHWKWKWFIKDQCMVHYDEKLHCCLIMMLRWLVKSFQLCWRTLRFVWHSYRNSSPVRWYTTSLFLSMSCPYEQGVSLSLDRKRSPIPWPPPSPDLIPLHIYVGARWLKDAVYCGNVQEVCESVARAVECVTNEWLALTVERMNIALKRGVPLMMTVFRSTEHLRNLRCTVWKCINVSHTLTDQIHMLFYFIDIEGRTLCV
jgi:hypothetical protein